MGGNRKLKAAKSAGKITEAEYAAKVRAKRAARKQKQNSKAAATCPGGTPPKKVTRRAKRVIQKQGINPAVVRRPNAPKNQNKQVRGITIQGTDRRNMQRYLECLIDPGGEDKGGPARIPTAEARDTALWSSVQECNVYANFSGNWVGPDAGRFSAAIQPIIGSPTAPFQYKIALVDGSNMSGWPTDFTAASSYTSIVDGFDTRVDPYVTTMTQQPPGFFWVDGSAGTATDALPFGSTPLILEDYSFEPFYQLPGGNWLIKPGNYFVSAQFVGGTLTYTAGPAVTPVGNVQISAVQAINGGGSCQVQFLIYVNGPDSGFNIQTVNGGVDMGSRMMITTSYMEPILDTNNLPMPPNISQGAVAGIRPVGLSALFTAEAATAFVGGACVGAYVAANTCTTNFFNNVGNDQIGQLQDWGNLAKVPKAYDEKYKDGLYGFWMPQDVSNIVFVTPNVMNNSEYPCLIFSGQCSVVGSTAPTGPVLIGRLKVWSVYEFVSLQTLWDMESILGCTQDYEDAWRFLRNQMKVMANDEHIAFKERIYALLKQAGISIAKTVGTKLLTAGLEALAV